MMGNPTQLWKTHLAFAKYHAAQHRGDEAARERQAAQRGLESVRDRLVSPALRRRVTVLVERTFAN